MVDARRTKRPYNSQRRQQQASATRRTVIDAAQRLFERDGYVATTMDAIAGEAGVALKTVYSAFTTKSGLLRAVWDLALKGDTDDVPVAQRAWYREVLDEPDPERQLRLNARNAVSVKVRIGPMLRVIRSASVVDPDGEALWRLIQSDFYENQRAIIKAIRKHGALRRGLSQIEASDILWGLNHPDVWLLLVGERGWTPRQFESWFADTTCQQLLEPAARSTV
jgi:AcrR family transcriptional regulator